MTHPLCLHQMSLTEFAKNFVKLTRLLKLMPLLITLAAREVWFWVSFHNELPSPPHCTCCLVMQKRTTIDRWNTTKLCGSNHNAGHACKMGGWDIFERWQLIFFFLVKKKHNKSTWKEQKIASRNQILHSHLSVAFEKQITASGYYKCINLQGECMEVKGLVSPRSTQCWTRLLYFYLHIKLKQLIDLAS